jgi:hypothetical protein
MSYYLSERVIDKLFGMNASTRWDEPLQHKGNYGRILGLALNHKEENIGSVAFGSQEQNETLLEIAKNNGLVLLTKLSGDFPSDHIIVVPMGVENGEPQDFWIIEMEEETYDAPPISSDLSDTVWRIHKLDVPFVRRMDHLLTEFYEARRSKWKKGYDAINKRVV